MKVLFQNIFLEMLLCGEENIWLFSMSMRYKGKNVAVIINFILSDNTTKRGEEDDVSRTFKNFNIFFRYIVIDFLKLP